MLAADLDSAGRRVDVKAAVVMPRLLGLVNDYS
jgi:hypothetical protein